MPNVRPVITSSDPALADLLALFEDQDVLDYTTLRARVRVSARSLDRQLSALLADGLLFRRSRGVYSRRPSEPSLNPNGRQLLGLLRRSDAEAHLTGFDVLTPYAHQFAYRFSHLVYCHPSHISGLAGELADGDWLVLPAGLDIQPGGGRERVVVVRGQTHDERRYPVRDHLALPEKAWVDLLREVRRSKLGFDYGELGRILRSLERAGVPLLRLRTYARNVGYTEWVDAALGDRPPNTVEQAQLAAGYAA
jgi:DNA-binding MarR family transcriptional regulator